MQLWPSYTFFFLAGGEGDCRHLLKEEKEQPGMREKNGTASLIWSVPWSLSFPITEITCSHTLIETHDRRQIKALSSAEILLGKMKMYRQVRRSNTIHGVVSLHNKIPFADSTASKIIYFIKDNERNIFWSQRSQLLQASGDTRPCKYKHLGVHTWKNQSNQYVHIFYRERIF